MKQKLSKTKTKNNKTNKQKWKTKQNQTKNYAKWRKKQQPCSGIKCIWNIDLSRSLMKQENLWY